jgi:DeoR family transcriptional regulator, fructose operon transcriptional repressor
LIIYEQIKIDKMSFQNRKQKILNLVEELGEISGKDLAESLQTSEITIRRDLAQLAKEGLLYRTHGGAMKVSLVNTPLSFSQKIAQNSEAKDYICSLAAKEIKDGDVIFMDCGSTVFRLCSLIKNKHIKIVTNSLPVVYEMLKSEAAVNLIGGELDKERQAIHGKIAVEHIKRYSVDKAFIGVDGISLKRGLTAKSEKEAEISLAMIKQAKTTYLLCDESKVNQEKYLQFADLDKIDVLVTNAENAILKGYKKVIKRILN